MSSKTQMMEDSPEKDALSKVLTTPMKSEKKYWVANEHGGYSQEMDCEFAHDIAEEHSSDGDCIMWVYQEGEYPEAIYYRGKKYLPRTDGS